jgi:hypothetical protein
LDAEITAEELKNFSSYVTLLAIKPSGNLMNGPFKD